MTYQNYLFRFECSTGTTERECTMEQAIENARNKILNGYTNKVVLKIYNKRRNCFVKLGDYSRAADCRPYRPTKEVPEPPEVVDVIPAPHKVPKSEYWNESAWILPKSAR